MSAAGCILRGTPQAQHADRSIKNPEQTWGPKKTHCLQYVPSLLAPRPASLNALEEISTRSGEYLEFGHHETDAMMHGVRII